MEFRQLSQKEMSALNAFDLAKYRTAQREARKAQLHETQGQMAEVAEVETTPVQDQVIKEIKEKPKKNGTFTVFVEMPHASFTFVLTKPSILSHAPSNRLTRDEIRKHVMEGLKPLLGGLE